MAQPRRCWGRTRNHTRCALEAEWFFCPIHKYQPFRWLLWTWLGRSLLSIFGIALAIYFRLHPLNPLTGILTPANEPSPPLPPHCPASEPTATIAKAFVGGGVVALAYAEHTPIIESAREEILSIDKETKGLTVSTQVFGADGKIVAELRKNIFNINHNNYFRLERPDEHQLVVYDQYNHQVWNIRYLNPYAVKILGEFYTTKGTKVVILDNAVEIIVRSMKTTITAPCIAVRHSAFTVD